MSPSNNAACSACGRNASASAAADDRCSCEAGRDRSAFWIEPALTFRGCSWDDGWEFDCPSVLYSPFKGRRDSGSCDVYGIVEDACIDSCLGKLPSKAWDDSDLHEFEWRGWSARGFARRRQAWHVEIIVKFFRDAEGEWIFEVASHRERFGLSGRWKNAS